METRARYALIGLFMLAVILASFGFVYWVENKGGFGQREAYHIRFEGSVSGLLVGSAVLFNGIRVGEVTSLALNPEQPQEVIATIAVDQGTPVRADTYVGIESQGLTGGVAVALRGGSASSPLPSADGTAPPTLVAAPGAGQDWTQSARDAFQRVDDILAENSEALHSTISNINKFSEALARNSDKVDGILAGLERLTGGGTGKSEIPLYSLAAATSFPPSPAEAPSWQLIIPEPTTLMGFNTDKILVQPSADESLPLENARWSDNLPALFQGKVLQSFENAGYAKSVSRTREGVTSNYQLLIDIRRFHVSTSSDPTAEISFLAKILDDHGKIIDARLFQGTAPVNGTDVKAYVGALDDAFGKLQTELVEWTTAALDTEPPPASPDQPTLDAAPLPPVTVEPPPAPDQPMP